MLDQKLLILKNSFLTFRFLYISLSLFIRRSSTDVYFTFNMNLKNVSVLIFTKLMKVTQSFQKYKNSYPIAPLYQIEKGSINSCWIVKILRYHSNQELLIWTATALIHVKKTNQNCAVKVQRSMSTEISQIEKLGYRAIIRYLYLNGWRSKQIY